MMNIKSPISITRPDAAQRPTPNTFAGKDDELKPTKEHDAKSVKGKAALKGDTVELRDKKDEDLDSVSLSSKEDESPEIVEAENEPVETINHPPADQYAAYNAEREIQKHLEWGRQFETPARVLGWVNNQLKNTSRHTTRVASDFGGVALDTASKAVVSARKAAAGVLRSAAQSLEGGPSPAALEDKKR